MSMEDFVDMPNEVTDEMADELVESADQVQDAVGEVCPHPQVEAKRTLQNMDDGELLVQETDHVPSVENVPNAVGDLAEAKVWKSGDGFYRIFLRRQ